jgi:hypothetical protein
MRGAIPLWCFVKHRDNFTCSLKITARGNKSCMKSKKLGFNIFIYFYSTFSIRKYKSIKECTVNSRPI